jgi:hypothetical protein
MSNWYFKNILGSDQPEPKPPTNPPQTSTVDPGNPECPGNPEASTVFPGNPEATTQFEPDKCPDEWPEWCQQNNDWVCNDDYDYAWYECRGTCGVC